MATVREFITKWGFRVNRTQLDRLENQMGRIRALATAATAVLAGTGLATAGLLKLSGELETNTIAFTTMLQSAEKANELLRDLSMFAAKTPFTIRDVRQNAKMLLGMGIEAEKLIPTMKALGDVASGTGGNFRRIALNFGQVRTQLRLTGRELVDFGVQGVPILQELAKNLNTTETAIKEMVTKGTISFDDVEKAFVSMSSAGGKFNNLMMEQSKSLPGLLSNTVDILTVLGESIGNDLLPIAKKMVKEFMGWVDVNRVFLKNDITPFLIDMMQVTIDLFNVFKATFVVAKKMAEPLGGLAFIFKVLTVSALAFAAAQLMVFTSSLVTMGIARLHAAMLFLNALYIRGGLAAIGMWAASLAGPLLAAASVLFLLLALEDFVKWVEGKDKTLLGSLLGDFEDFDLDPIDVAKGALISFKEVIEEVKKEITLGLEGAWISFQETMEEFDTNPLVVMKDALIALKKLLEGTPIETFWLDPLIELLREANKLVKELFEKIDEKSIKVISKIAQGKFGEAVEAAVPPEAKVVGKFLEVGGDHILGKVGEALDTVSEFFGVKDLINSPPIPAITVNSPTAPTTPGRSPKTPNIVVRSPRVPAIPVRSPSEQVGVPTISASSSGGTVSNITNQNKVDITVDGAQSPEDTADAIQKTLNENIQNSFEQNRNQVRE